MTQNFKKLALAAGVSVGMAAMSMPSHATINGAPGEALLVPLVVYATPGVSGYYANTYVQVSTPGAIGFDDVPNIFLDSNTTPTNADATLFPLNESLAKVGGATIHWYWFDARSVHRLDKPLHVTANDTVFIDWEASARSSGTTYDGVAGYMVIGTETARRGVAADFNLFGDAWLALDAVGDLNDAGTFNEDGAALASIPVYPMADGKDQKDDKGNPLLSIADGVHYKGGIPDAVSPLISGMRTNRSDGVADLTAFDLTLFSRYEPSLHVVWLDQNLGSTSAPNYVPVDVYDSEEMACSATVDLRNELNVIWIKQLDGNGVPVNPDQKFFAQTAEGLCHSSNDTVALGQPSFVTYYLDEYVDTNVDRPESAGVVFTLIWATDGPNQDTNGFIDRNADEWSYSAFGQTMLLGHERGLFRQ